MKNKKKKMTQLEFDFMNEIQPTKKKHSKRELRNYRREKQALREKQLNFDFYDNE
jgi:hypothetical protein